MSILGNKFNFYDVDVISRHPNANFYFEVAKNRTRVYKVTPELFKEMLVLASLSRNSTNIPNSFTYLFEQLEMTEDIFTALLYSDWVYEPI